MAFMLRMPVQLVDMRQFGASQADTDFGAKFNRFAKFSWRFSGRCAASLSEAEDYRRKAHQQCARSIPVLR